MDAEVAVVPAALGKMPPHYAVVMVGLDTL
jgi:hypothetical protein